MSHKQSYYSDKYDDEEFVYRLVPARGQYQGREFGQLRARELVTGTETAELAHAREVNGNGCV